MSNQWNQKDGLKICIRNEHRNRKGTNASIMPSKTDRYVIIGYSCEYLGCFMSIVEPTRLGKLRNTVNVFPELWDMREDTKFGNCKRLYWTINSKIIFISYRKGKCSPIIIYQISKNLVIINVPKSYKSDKYRHKKCYYPVW